MPISLVRFSSGPSRSQLDCLISSLVATQHDIQVANESRRAVLKMMIQELQTYSLITTYKKLRLTSVIVPLPHFWKVFIWS